LASNENSIKSNAAFFLSYVLFSFALFPVVQEIYSIKLPGNPKLGEGKPENQNHAIIFTRGQAVQTIDMNQVNILDEWCLLLTPARCNVC